MKIGILSMMAAAVLWMGCVAPVDGTGGEGDESEQTGDATEAQRVESGPGTGTLNYTCTSDGDYCVCHGEADCIDLYQSGECDGALTCPSGATYCTCWWRS
jgi:hypothetical protein